jgi:hypothetical protein
MIIDLSSYIIQQFFYQHMSNFFYLFPHFVNYRGSM